MEIAICDDEKEIRDMLAEKIGKLYPQAGLSLYRSGEELLLAEKEPDILLLDIQMPGKNGMETAKELRRKNKKAIIIFVTALEDFVFQAFDVGAFHYLVTENLRKYCGMPWNSPRTERSRKMQAGKGKYRA